MWSNLIKGDGAKAIKTVQQILVPDSKDSEDDNDYDNNNNNNRSSSSQQQTTAKPSLMDQFARFMEDETDQNDSINDDAWDDDIQLLSDNEGNHCDEIYNDNERNINIHDTGRLNNNNEETNLPSIQQPAAPNSTTITLEHTASDFTTTELEHTTELDGMHELDTCHNSATSDTQNITTEPSRPGALFEVNDFADGWASDDGEFDQIMDDEQPVNTHLDEYIKFDHGSVSHSPSSLPGSIQINLTAGTSTDDMQQEQKHKQSQYSTASDNHQYEAAQSVPSSTVVDFTSMDSVPDSQVDNQQLEAKTDVRSVDSVAAIIAVEGLATEAEEGEDDVYDDENEHSFGRVVDHTPVNARPRLYSRKSSLAVQAQTIAADIAQDDAMENSTCSGSVPDHDDLLSSQSNAVFVIPEDTVVDSLPNSDEVSPRRSRPDGSVGVLFSDDGNSTIKFDEDAPTMFGLVVDHTPVSNFSFGISGTDSLAVQTSALEEDFQADDAMDETLAGSITGGGQSLVDTQEQGTAKTTYESEDDDVTSRDSLSPPPTPNRANYQPRSVLLRNRSQQKNSVVDQTPSEMQAYSGLRSNSSVAVLATEEDLTRDTGTGNDEEIYDDENEFEYGPIVDQLPNLTKSVPVSNGECSLVALDPVAGEESRKDDLSNSAIEEDGDGWEAEDGDEEEVKGKFVSSVGGEEKNVKAAVSFKSDGLESVVLVDHTPSEIEFLPPNPDPSVRVLASVEEHQSVAEASEYGPVVDQIPSNEISSERSSVSKDLIRPVQLTDMDTVHGVYGNGSTVDPSSSTIEPDDSATSDGEDDDNFDEDLPLVTRFSAEDQVVDRIPQRSDSRLGDESTFVAADPSDMLSDVDDMGQEDNFGPVVDLTPPTRPSPVLPNIPYGSASTAVFASQSVTNDDLDADADETTINGEDNLWENDNRIVEEAPNPQSGNDEPLDRLDEQQVVDYLPLRNVDNDVVQEVLVEEDSSEVAVGGAYSLALQAEDPVEDDFGPVVDQTPAPMLSIDPSGISTASVLTQVTVNECQAMNREDRADSLNGTIEPEETVLVDQLPLQIREKAQMDSLGTANRSHMTEEEEEEDDSKFGPVVDHLPTSRASLAPSRGGSTVDALATVSEVDSDEDEGEDWGDDTEIDTVIDTEVGSLNAKAINESPSVIATEHDNKERITSIRWEPSLDDTTRTKEDLSMKEDILCISDDAQGNLVGVIDSHNIFHRGNNLGCRGDSLPHREGYPILSDVSFAEADTPPSTPHKRPSLLSSQSKGTLSTPTLDVVDAFAQSQSLCPSCTAVASTSCPCVSRLMLSNLERGQITGTLTADDGQLIEVDLGRMLQDEIMKRKLSEELCAALQAKNAMVNLVDIDNLRKENDDSRQWMKSLKEENDDLRKKILVYDSTSLSLKSAITSLNQEKAAWADRESEILLNVQLSKDEQAKLLSTIESSGLDYSRKLAELQNTENKLQLAKYEIESLNAALIKAKDIETTSKRTNEELVQKILTVTKINDMKVAELETQLQSFEQNQQDSEEILKEHVNDKYQLQHKCNVLKAELKAKDEVMIQTLREVEGFRNTIEQLSLENKRTADDLDYQWFDTAYNNMDLKHAARLLLKHFECMRKTNIFLKEERDKAISDALGWKVECEGAILKNNELEYYNSKLDEKTLDLSKKLKELQLQHNELTSKVDEYREVIFRASKQKDEAIFDLRVVNDKCNTWIQRNDLLNISNETLSRKLDATKLELAESQELCSRLLSETNNLKQSLEQQNAQYQLCYSDLQKALMKLNLITQDKISKETEIGTLMKKLERESQRHIAEMNDQKSSLLNVENELKLPDRLKSDHVASIKESRYKLTQSNGHDSNSTSDYSEPLMEMNELNNVTTLPNDQQFLANGQHKHELKVLEAELSHARKIYTSLQEEYNELNAQLQLLTREKYELMEENDDMLVQLGLMKQELDLVVDGANLKVDVQDTNNAKLLSNNERKTESNSANLASKCNIGAGDTAVIANICKHHQQIENLEAELKQRDVYVENLKRDISMLTQKMQLLEVNDRPVGTQLQLLTLAKVLAQSETKRAAVVERLLSERQSNATSLRRLNESLKRFYSSM